MKEYIKMLCIIFFLSLASCTGVGLFYADGEITKPMTSKKTVVIIGLELSCNLNSAKIQLNMNGKTKTIGSIIKGKRPEN